MIILSVLLIFSCKVNQKDYSEVDYDLVAENADIQPIGKIEKLDIELDKYISASAQIEIIAKGYKWTEGPLWIDTLKTLIWSDVPANTIYQWKEGEEAKVYLSPSGYTGKTPSQNKEPGSNGLLLNPEGKLVLCQHGDRRVSFMDADIRSPKAKFVPIAESFQGKKFNSPNDAVYDDEGNLYFTDPPYGLKTQDDQSPEKELEFNGVYKVSPKGEITVLVDSLTRPNGIAFNPEFTKCYIANSDPKKAYWAVYNVTPEKTFEEGRVFFDATSLVSQGKKGLPDGLVTDDYGTLYATGPGGVLVLTSSAQHIGTINTQQATSNCTFDKDKTTLYITADSYVMRLKL